MWMFSKKTPSNQRPIPDNPDLPMPFGFKCSWYTVASRDTGAVVEAIGLRDARPANWSNGLKLAYEQSVFVSPPIQDWTFIVSFLFAPSTVEAVGETRPRLQRLSEIFQVAMLYGTHRVVSFTLWAKAVRGELIRGYGYADGVTFWNEGLLTNEERELELAFFDETSTEAHDPNYWDRNELDFPDEETVMDVAREWSICPDDLEQYAAAAGESLGVVGRSSQLLSCR